MIKPLAFRMRPKSIDDIVGQSHLVGPGQIIRRMVDAKRLSSMILYGPPGIGKTSIASAIAGSTQYAFRILNAATDAKKDLEAIVEETKISGTVILLLDEIHRLNKTKQDFLLPHMEKGSIILIGATTENPYITINPAIRSRAQIFELKPLQPNDISNALDRALTDKTNGLGDYPIDITPEAITLLSTGTNGDLRSSLNALELATLSTERNRDGRIVLTHHIMESCLQRKYFSHDKNGDSHYDTISAFQKSIRGSDVDASLHYLARLIEAGDLPTIIRRLLVIAYEDIGLANPSAAERTFIATQVAERVGFPEARIPLANAVIELALSPKSNSAIMAIDDALNDIRSGRFGDIPDHLKDTHYSGASQLNRGVDYLYPHAFDGHWVKQDYLPEALRQKRYYKPVHTGKYEHALSLQLEKYNNKV
ncbi:replication-associated recombination protein A [Carnobacteriaceae bacterium zg-C25]|nr:replication-associated recombination protein A [Carnobacteriaceae bacterium zg-C25]